MFTKFEDNGEVDIYINGEVVAEEGEDFEGDMLHGGVNNYVTSSGGEDFDDSDSEYEYKMDEEKDEDEERARDDWGVEGDLVENIVKKANDEKMGEGRVEDTDLGEARVSDTDARRLEVDEAAPKKRKGRPGPVMREGSSTIKRQQSTIKCGKCGLQGHNARGCHEKDARTDPIPDASSQVQPNSNVIQVPTKGKGIMQEPKVPLQARTRSGQIPTEGPKKLQGHIGGVGPVIRNPQKSCATAPTMFQQFQECQKGIRIKEPAPFVEGQSGARSLQEQGSSGSTPSIVKGGKKFVTMSNLSQAVNQIKKGKKEALIVMIVYVLVIVYFLAKNCIKTIRSNYLEMPLILDVLFGKPYF
ncbi:hypothetical protein Salat_2522500 [Sesamum alatum]|uniref:CCHC-type domain-containing protein n=1 Tax=Sesamum alatum TaxID=300844 RepID=A0AAE1XRY0_9LAMI|nr:hypothetical protein Salat_2522500 [Sesamum alatum]